MTTTDADLDAAVRRVLGDLLTEGAPYTALPLVDPVTKLLPPPTVDAIRAPLVALTTTGRLGEVELSATIETVAGEAVEAAIEAASTHDGVFIPSSLAALRWRQTRTRVLAGDRQGSILVHGDSIPFGAATTGASNPKWQKSYPGRMRSILASQYGYAGGGLTLANDSVLTNGAWDPRWTFSGAIANQAFGPFKKSAYRIPAASAAYIEFTDVCEAFTLYFVPAGGSGGLITIQVDGVTVGTVSNRSNYGGSPSLPRRTGYFAQGSQAHNVVDVPAGALGSHKIKIIPPSDSSDVYLIAIEARATAGKWRVGNASVSSQSLNSFGWGPTNNDDTAGLYGRPWIDTFRADLLVDALGINDWQGQRSIAYVKDAHATMIARQRATGTSVAGSGTAPGGDVVLVWNPKPDTATLGGGAYTNPSYEDCRAAMYELAIEQDVCLIDMTDRWGGFTTANARGLFSDTIHPSDAGADDIAAGMVHALFNVI